MYTAILFHCTYSPLCETGDEPDSAGFSDCEGWFSPSLFPFFVERRLSLVFFCVSCFPLTLVSAFSRLSLFAISLNLSCLSSRRHIVEGDADSTVPVGTIFEVGTWPFSTSPAPPRSNLFDDFFGDIERALRVARPLLRPRDPFGRIVTGSSGSFPRLEGVYTVSCVCG